MYNKTIMIGNLTRDIEIKYLPSGSAVGNSSIASTYRYKNSTGEQVEDVCFLEFSIFGKTAEAVALFIKRGSKVLIEGRLALESWTDTNDMRRSKHKLRVETIKALDKKADNTQEQQQSQQQQPQNIQSQQQQPEFVNIDDGIPF